MSDDDGTIQARFEAFHVEHPDVYRHLVRLARDYQRRGYAHEGIAHLWEIVRWQIRLDSDYRIEGRTFKLNNDYKSRYARLIMESEPDLAGFFRTRALTVE